jgi:hypothetical protein
MKMIPWRPSAYQQYRKTYGGSQDLSLVTFPPETESPRVVEPLRKAIE